MVTHPSHTGTVEDIWMNEPDLRRYLGYSASTMSRLRKRELPHVGQDRLRRYHLPTVLQWLSEHS